MIPSNLKEKQIKHSLLMIKYQLGRTVNEDMRKHLKKRKKELEKELTQIS